MNLDSKTKYLVGYWRPREPDPELLAKCEKLIRYFREKAETFAVVVHDLDVDDKGERVTPHIHFVANMLQCRYLRTQLNEISDALGVDTISVSVDKASSVTRSIRYLIHKDNPEKHQYSISDVFHNWNDAEFLKVFSDKDKEEITYDYLARLCKRAVKISEVISIIGLGAYRYWRPVIMDIWKDYHNA